MKGESSTTSSHPGATVSDLVDTMCAHAGRARAKCRTSRRERRSIGYAAGRAMVHGRGGIASSIERLAHAVSQLLEGVGLAQQLDLGIERAVVHDGVARIAGRV